MGEICFLQLALLSLGGGGAIPDFCLFLGGVAFLDFPPLVASFPGFEAPVAQLDRVYDFGS